jgi:hypothetical protein
MGPLGVPFGCQLLSGDFSAQDRQTSSEILRRGAAITIASEAAFVDQGG